PIPASILSARASGAKESFSRAREMPPAIAASETPAFLKTSIIFCSSPTLIQGTSSAAESSARSLSLRCATAMTFIPRWRAARATSSGKTPLPAMSPSLFTLAADDSALRVVYEINRPHDLRHLRARRHDRVSADAAELMHPDLALANRVLLDNAVAGQPRARRQDHVVADDAVVRHVRVRHHQRVTADFGFHPAAFGAAVNGRELADHVVVADFDDRRFALEFEVLWFPADGGELPDAIALTDRGITLDHRAGADHAAGSYLDVRSDHRARTDFDARVEF